MICTNCSLSCEAGTAFCSNCGTRFAAGGASARVSRELAPGTMLHATYRIERTLGVGGFGVTYLATDTKLNRLVALKEFFPLGCARTEETVLPPSTGWSEDAWREGLRRFQAEAQTLAGFDDRGIVRIHATFEERGTAWLVMEYVAGCWRERRRSRQRTAWSACSWCRCRPSGPT